MWRHFITVNDCKMLAQTCKLVVDKKYSKTCGQLILYQHHIWISLSTYLFCLNSCPFIMFRNLLENVYRHFSSSNWTCDIISVGLLFLLVLWKYLFWYFSRRQKRRRERFLRLRWVKFLWYSGFSIAKSSNSLYMIDRCRSCEGVRKNRAIGKDFTTLRYWDD